MASRALTLLGLRVVCLRTRAINLARFSCSIIGLALSAHRFALIRLVVENLVRRTCIASVVLEFIDGSISGADLALEDSRVPQGFLGRASRLSIRNLIDARFTSSVVNLILAAHNYLTLMGCRVVEVPAIACHNLWLTLFSRGVVVVASCAGRGQGLAFSSRAIIVRVSTAVEGS